MSSLCPRHGDMPCDCEEIFGEFSADTIIQLIKTSFIEGHKSSFGDVDPDVCWKESDVRKQLERMFGREVT